MEYLRARGTLATWLGDYDRAQDTYRRLCGLLPEDHELTLNLARVSAWGGRTDAAVAAYGRYLRARPDATAVLIELARTEGWRGNYATALETLEKYRNAVGVDAAYSRERAALLARAGRPAEALDILDPMLRQHPDDYELNLTRTVALAMLRRPRETADALGALRRLRPDAGDTKTAERVVRTALASTVDPGVSVYSDSSSLEVQRVAPRATVSFPTGTTLAVGSEHERLAARAGSGLEQAGGNHDARHDQIWASVAHQFGGVTLRGRVGQARTEVRDLTAYAIGADLMPVDGLKVSVERSSGFFVVSPRTIGLGLEQVSHRVQLDSAPTMRTRMAADVLYQTLSDGNRRWEFTISPSRSVARTARLNLDLGAVVTQLRTRTNFDHGYYDPSLYQVLRDDGQSLLEGQRTHRRGTIARHGNTAGRLQPGLPSWRECDRRRDVRHLRPLGGEGHRRGHVQPAAGKRRVPWLWRHRVTDPPVLVSNFTRTRSNRSCAH